MIPAATETLRELMCPNSGIITWVSQSFMIFRIRMTVSLAEDGIRMAMETDHVPELSDTVLPVEQRSSEDTVFLTVRSRKGGKAA